MAVQLTDAVMYRDKTETEIVEIKKWREVYRAKSDDEVLRLVKDGHSLRPAAFDAAFFEVLSRDSMQNLPIPIPSPPKKKIPKTRTEILLGFLVVAFILFRILLIYWVNK